MRIELAGWSASGLRCPNVRISLRPSDGAPARIALIQMPNGTGKTTMLQLLSATLSGSAQSWNSEQVMSFRRPGAENDRGLFEAHLLVDGRQLSVELTLDFAAGNATYRTTNPGSGGVMQGWRVPPAVHRFLTPEFLSLFIFDGEFADRLLDPRHHEAEKAIDALCQLYLLDHVREVVGEYWEAATHDVGARTSVGLQKWQRVESKLRSRIAEVKRARSEAVAAIAVNAKRLTELQSEIAARISGVEQTRDSYEDAKKRESDAKELVASSSTQLLGLLRNPISVHSMFAQDLRALRESLDRLRLPENTSAQFFEELLEEPECICGRLLDDDARLAISERSRRYLDSDEAGTLNALKLDIARHITGDGDAELEHGRVLQVKQVLSGAVRARDTAKTNARTLRTMLIDAGDEELKRLQDEEAKLTEQNDALETLLEAIDGDGDSNTGGDQEMALAKLEADWSDARARIAEITRTVQLRKQTDIVREIVADASASARDRIRSELIDESNRLLEAVLIQAPVSVSGIDRSIRLRGQHGASVGQTLSVGYVFLLSVLQRGRNQFPLVVDSPANPIDKGVRREIARLIPKLSNQFVGFTINTERPGFVETIDEEHSDTLFMTLFRRTPASEHLLARLPQEASVVNEDAVLVTDRDFFFSFDIDKEA